MFPRPDDPLDPPSDQLGPLYESGPAQPLGHARGRGARGRVLVRLRRPGPDARRAVRDADNLEEELTQTRVAHVNADFPAEYAGDGPAASPITIRCPRASPSRRRWSGSRRCSRTTARPVRSPATTRARSSRTTSTASRRSATTSSAPSSARCGTRRRGSSRPPQPRPDRRGAAAPERVITRGRGDTCTRHS